MPIQIKAVDSKKELKTFVRFANNMYKDNKYYVPAIVFDELSTFDKKKNGGFPPFFYWKLKNSHFHHCFLFKIC